MPEAQWNQKMVPANPWWRHQMETFSVLLAICAGNWPVPGEFPTQRPVTGSFDVFFDLRLNKQLSKQWWGWWFEMLACPLWRQRNAVELTYYVHMMRNKPNEQILTLLVVSPEYSMRTKPIPMLPMPWSHAMLGHQRYGNDYAG